MFAGLATLSYFFLYRRGTPAQPIVKAHGTIHKQLCVQIMQDLSKGPQTFKAYIQCSVLTVYSVQSHSKEDSVDNQVSLVTVYLPPSWLLKYGRSQRLCA